MLFLAWTGNGCRAELGSITRPTRALVVGIPEGPSVGDSGITQAVRMLTTDGLTGLSVDGRVEPRLVSGWRWENDGLRLRLTLRQGVTLHTGQPLSPQLVVTFLQRAVRTARNLALYPSFNSITTIQPDGQHDVLIDLSSRSAFLPEDLEIPFEILPEDLDIPFETGSPAKSTGAFQIVDSSGSDFVLRAFDKYRGGRPNIDEVVVKPIPTLRTAWSNLLRGDVDIVTDVPPDAVEFITNDDVRVVSFERRYQYVLTVNQNRAMFRSPSVRRALNLAIDRESLVLRVLNGRGSPSTGPLWPKYWAYDAAMAPYAYDPAAAEALLEGEKLPRGTVPGGPQGPTARLRFTCMLPADFALYERIALEVQRSLYAIGIDMRLELVPFRRFDERLREGNFDCAIVDLISGPTPGRTYLFWRSAKTSKGLNVFGYENPEAERLFQTLITSSNEAVVRSTTRRLQRVFMEDPPAVFIAWNERARAVRRDFVIPGEGERDPLLTLWQWSPAAPQVAAAR